MCLFFICPQLSISQSASSLPLVSRQQRRGASSLSVSFLERFSRTGAWLQVIPLVAALLLTAVSRTGSGQEAPSPQLLPNHVPQLVSGQVARYVGVLPEEQKIQLSIVLPLRNQ